MGAHGVCGVQLHAEYHGYEISFLCWLSSNRVDAFGGLLASALTGTASSRVAVVGSAGVPVGRAVGVPNTQFRSGINGWIRGYLAAP